MPGERRRGFHRLRLDNDGRRQLRRTFGHCGPRLALAGIHALGDRALDPIRLRSLQGALPFHALTLGALGRGRFVAPLRLPLGRLDALGLAFDRPQGDEADELGRVYLAFRGRERPGQQDGDFRTAPFHLLARLA